MFVGLVLPLQRASAELPPPPTPIATYEEPIIHEEYLIEENSFSKTCAWYLKEADGSDIGWIKVGMTGSWLIDVVKGTNPKSTRGITDANYKWIFVQDNFGDFPTAYLNTVVAWKDMKLKHIPSGTTYHWVYGIVAKGSVPNKMTCRRYSVSP